MPSGFTKQIMCWSDGNGVAPDANPPTEWSADSENLKWKTEIPGKGTASPIVWGDKIFIIIPRFIPSHGALRV